MAETTVFLLRVWDGSLEFHQYQADFMIAWGGDHLWSTHGFSVWQLLVISSLPDLAPRLCD